MTRSQVARRLLSLLRPLAPLLAVSVTARVINQALGVAIPALAAALVVGMDVTPPRIVIGLGGLALLKGLFRYLEQFTGHAVAFRLLSTLRIDTYRWVTPLAPAGLEADRTGDLVSRVIGDVDRVEPFYAHTIAPITSAILVPMVVGLGVAVWIDPTIAVVYVTLSLLIALLVPWMNASRVAALSGEGRRRSGEAAATMTEAVQGAREIAIFGARGRVIEHLDEEARRSGQVRTALARVGAARVLLGEVLAGTGVVVMAALAIRLFESGAVDLAGVAAAIVVAWAGTAPAKAMQDIVPDLEQALASAGRLFELSDRPPPVPVKSPGTGTPKDGSVEFEGVSVRWPSSGVQVLDDVTVEIRDGSFTAVVGPSGSGKSTLVELLARFRDPDHGTVRIGGADIRDIAWSDLRSRITLIPQRPDIFFGSIDANLRLANPTASDADLWRALERAALGPWAEALPKGLATPVGELGDALSGGQRQRLAIARALLRDSPILILDEATSELDGDTERRVLQTLLEERVEQTVIVVAHRMETVTDADEIIVLDRGRLVERGRHIHLLEHGGVYAGLWMRHLDVAEVG